MGKRSLVRAASATLLLALLGASCGYSVPDLAPGGGGGGAGAGAGGGSSDGGGDGSSPSAFCASLVPKPLLCDDFGCDVVNDPRCQTPESFFKTSTSVGGGDLAIDKSTFTSGPSSLHVTMPPSTRPYYYGTRGLLAGYTTMRFTFRLRVDAVDPGAGEAVPMNVKVGNYSLRLVISGAGLVVRESVLGPDGGPGNTDHVLTTVLSLGAWRRGVFGYENGRVTGSLDGQSFDEPGTTVPTVPNAVVTFGMATSTVGSGPWSLHLDDVTFDAK